ncbi:MAG: fimbrillin family protein [Bacteroidales bacterium]|nr:fimbrillin family protein [Bacteroidales bacterium]
MKTYTKSAVILLAALAFVGCSKTEEFQNNSDSALEIASVSGILSYTPMSKAVITGDSLPDTESAKGIGLFVTAADGGAYDGKTEGFSNVRYTYNGEKWSTTTPVYLSKTEGKLYGYFPYSEAATKLMAIPVASSLNGTDYLYATPNDVSYSQKSVSLQMNHALARLHLTIKKGDKYLKDCELSKIAIESDAIAATGTMNIITGVVTGLKDEGATGSVVFEGDGVTGTVTEKGIEKDILLVPASTGEGKKDLSLTLTIDGADAKILFSGEGGLDIRRNTKYTVTLYINNNMNLVFSKGRGGEQIHAL